MGNEVAAQAGVRSAVGLPAIPDHLKAAMAAAGDGNIKGGASTNTLSFGGKTFKMTINGETKVLQKWDEEAGAMVNTQVIQLVVLDQSDRGRKFYEKGYDPESPKAPDCWSKDGKRPHENVEAPQCQTCGACPKAIKGSRMVEGREMVACSGFRFLAVQPVKMVDGKPVIAHDFPPMRLSLAPTSIWDEQDDESANAGWYGWDNLTKLMRSNGAQWTNASIVRVRFANTDYAKIQFARGDYLSAEDFHKTLARAKQQDVIDMLAGYTATARPENGTQASKGKPLPADDNVSNGPAPTGSDPVFSQSGAAAEAAQKAEAAKVASANAAQAAATKAIYDAEVAVKAKKAADAKAKKIAEAKALLAAAESEAQAETDLATKGVTTAPADAPGAFDDTPPPVKNVAAPVTEQAPASAPAEVPEALTTILGDWD